jgi:tRNA threonylcarbamoyladenosine biosynthesis protein TsaE
VSANFELTCRRDTRHLARALATHVAPGDLVLLDGALGAGKTFFTRAFLRALGVPEAERVTSPTFTLVHRYDARLPAGVASGPRLVLHADLYRLRDAAELDALDLLEGREDGAVLLVEWGRPFEAALGGDALTLAIQVRADGRRVVAASSSGARSSTLLADLAAGDVGVRRDSC